MPEHACCFTSQGQQLTAILHSVDCASVGVVIVVGGPQYRVGSHRQFVHLARALAGQGIPVLRFDVTGMGDSSGKKKLFDDLDADIAAAVNCFQQHCPELEKIVLLGLCDGASAALIYAHRDPRLAGLVLLNPWLENRQAKAKAQVSHYYRRRFLDPGFWRKLIKGKGNPVDSVWEFGCTLWQALLGDKGAGQANDASGNSYQQRMFEGLRKYPGRVLLVLSGNDLTAKEFSQQLAQDMAWAKLVEERSVSRLCMETADHTFSTRQAKDWVARQTQTFVTSLRE
ncbi:hydrolase 1, exosortase A system-associated [Marinobacterium sedimentorum]|uniref:hydrolase 1, exosortase A system-associated n=1 Tax=Marinobacterium sedimentorum TaxID=2927804 RepID=UPI0020C6C15F|nr:hydrolase 1, exosortase A system-associated [Marinobacterium sedimentorum]MCP8686785.1 hydrolase 1, exosortase A system-associated [Marinobacterium sedimentorum]